LAPEPLAPGERPHEVGSGPSRRGLGAIVLEPDDQIVAHGATGEIGVRSACAGALPDGDRRVKPNTF
jgi:hypothetical protein